MATSDPEIIQNKSVKFLFPILLFVIGLVSLSGFEIFGAAFLESAPWKQNMIFSVLITFGLIPPVVRAAKSIWMIAGYALAFFMFGGANMPGTVGIVLGIFKILCPIMILLQTLRLRYSSRNWKKLIILPVSAFILSVILMPIQDTNLVSGMFNSLISLSIDKYSSDGGFHILIGLISIICGTTELLITTSELKPSAGEDLGTCTENF